MGLGVVVKNTDCTICNKPFVTHLISGELTCFIHGNPQGSKLEQMIYAEWLNRHRHVLSQQVAIENEQMS